MPKRKFREKTPNSERPTRNRRPSNEDVAPAAAVVASASGWADFMADEGGSSSPSAAAAVPSSGPAPDASAFEYDLPLAPRTVEPGVLAATGTLDAARVGRVKGVPPNDDAHHLFTPTTLCSDSVFDRKRIAVLAASCSSVHSIVVTEDGAAYAWGRNEQGQCGLGFRSRCVPLPTRLGNDDEDGVLPEGCDATDFVGAAVGKSHSILIAGDGACYAVGHNKYGQCGVNTSLEHVRSWKRCVVVANDGDVKIVRAACGENFTVLLDSRGRMYSAGHGEFGQLGNGETGEHFVTANKIAFGIAKKFERRSVFVRQMEASVGGKLGPAEVLPDSESIAIGDVVCGKNHAVAVEAPSRDGTARRPRRVFTWGYGGYGVLGHGVQEDRHTPQLVNVFAESPVFANHGPVRAAAGPNCTLVLTSNGRVHYCGRHKSVGEAAMRFAQVDEMANSAREVSSAACNYQTVFLCTNNGVTVSWGQGPHGELGYGRDGARSSSKPVFVEALDKVLVTDVACGYGHTLFLLRRKDAEDKKLLKGMPKVEKKDVEEFVEECEKHEKDEEEEDDQE